MKYFGFMPNDFINGTGVSVSLWTAGCPFHCVGCHNSEMWNYEDGTEVNIDALIERLKNAITANGIVRNFSVLGGEPLAPYNYENVKYIIHKIREAFPQIKIYLWTGYYKEDIPDKSILDDIDVLIDGPFILEERDISLPLRGSRNQHVYNLR